MYVDTSLSMAGYSRQLGRTLHRLLTELHSGAGVQEIKTFLAAGFAEEVAAVESIPGPTAALGWTFAALTTCLPSPLRAIAADNSDDTLYVVLTDGVPSASPAGSSCGCGTSVDINCVAEQLTAIVRAGYGLWLVGVKAEFSGTYYPEMPPRGKLPLKDASRPVYLWLISRHIGAGRAVAAHITGAVNAPVISGEMWPGEWNGHEVTPLKGTSQLLVAHQAACGSENAQAQMTSFSTRREPPGPVQHLTLTTSSGPMWWKMRLPSRAYKDAPRTGVIALTRAAGNPPQLTSGGRVVWRAPDDDSAACIELREPSLLWTTMWDIQVATDPLAEWSTSNDADPNESDKTLLLHQLWSNVGQRIRGSSGTIEVPVVTANRQP
jgi:hypothetical protein